MSLHCHYHPQHNARWHCPECQQKYCQHCLDRPERLIQKQSNSCPQCAMPLQALVDDTSFSRTWVRHGSLLRSQFGLSYLLNTSLIVLMLSLWALSGLGFSHSVALFISHLIACCAGLPAIEAIASEGRRPKKWPSIRQLVQHLDAKRHASIALLITTLSFSPIWLWQADMGIVAMLALVCLLAALPIPLVREVMAKPKPSLARCAHDLMLKHQQGYQLAVLRNISIWLGTALVVDFCYAQLSAPWALALSSTTVLSATGLSTLVLALLACELQQDARLSQTSTKIQRSDAELELELALRQGRYDYVAGLLEDELARAPADHHFYENLAQTLEHTRNWPALAKHSQSIVYYYLQTEQVAAACALIKLLRARLEGYQMADIKLMLSLAKRSHREHGELVLWLAKTAHLRFTGQYLSLAELYLLAAKVAGKQAKSGDQVADFRRKAQHCLSQHKATQG